MGLLDILNGMQNGPRGQTSPAPAGRGGMSPIAMALLGLVAYKAIKQLSPGQANATPTRSDPSTGGNAPAGGLGGLLQGPLGGLLAGGAAGSVLSGGLNDLLKQFQQNGQGDKAESWVARGDNKSIEPTEVEQALGEERIAWLMQQTGMSREELLKGLSQELPQAIDRMTPEGRIPSPQETEKMVA